MDGTSSVRRRRIVADLRSNFGIESIDCEPLGSENADTFRVTARSGTYAVKAFPLTTPAAEALVRWQCQLQSVLHDAGHPAPELIRSLEGEHLSVGREHLLLGMNWLQGSPLAKVQLAPREITALIGKVADITQTLQCVASPPPHQVHSWDIRMLTHQLSTLVPVAQDYRELLEWSFARTHAQVERAVTISPHELIHQDLNDSNLLVDANHALSAVLDFSDAAEGPRVADPAFFAAYLARCTNRPDEVIDEVTQMFVDRGRIDDAEAATLPAVAVARLAHNLVVNQGRERAQVNAEYATQRYRGSVEALTYLQRRGYV